MFKANSKLILTLTLFTLVSFATAALAYETWVDPSETPGHTYKEPPSKEQIEQWLKDRNERHACKQKSSLVAEKFDPLNPLVITEPTPNQYDYDVRYYKIDIEINLGGETVDGYVDMYALATRDNLTYVDLNLSDQLNVTDTRLDGVSQSFTHGGDILAVNFTTPLNDGDLFTVRVYYNGTPNYSNLDGMDFYTFNGRKVCYTNCEPWGARNWWPCKDFPMDKPDSADIIITYPTTYGGYSMDLISNGTLVSETVNGSQTTTHWHSSHPITTYLVALVLTDFSRYNQQWEYETGQFMPVEHNYFPGVPPSATWGSTYYMVQYTIPSLDALSHYWGMYPFVNEKYGHMHYGWGGAMEHQTSTSIGPYFNTEYVIAHELGHQWAGDEVTCSPFNHMWLNEGFASYSEVLYFEYQYGDVTAKQWLNGQKHLGAGSPYVENLQTDNIFDGTTVYDKGSWLVHMLRHQMGDSLFFPAMQYYFADSEFSGRAANTNDLNSVVSDFYGEDMSWFFDAWVYQDGNPVYKYSYVTEEDTENGGYIVDFFLEQNNEDGVFPMWVEIEAYSGVWDTLFRVWNKYAGDPYTFHFPYDPEGFVIDPDDKILKANPQEVPWAMHIQTGSIPDAVVGEPFSFSLEAVAGVEPYTWQKILGQLPYPLTLNTSTGEISGTPSFVGSYYFKVRCTDSDSPAKVDERGYVMNIIDPPFVIGDVNTSGAIDIDDIVFLITYVFQGGPAPDPEHLGDVNCTGAIDIDDIVYLIAYVFQGGPAPCDG